MTDPRRTDEPDSERRALRLVEHALELPVDQRDAYLIQETAGHAGLLDAARRLLAACEHAEHHDAFLGAPAARYADDLVREVDAADDAELARSVARVAAQLDGRYAIEREIGSGGNAVVYLARDTRHDRPVAIKVIRQDHTGESQRARFAREVAIIAQLRHPYVVPLIDSGEADGTLYYVMPFIDGESLRHHLDAQSALSIAETLGIARDVAEALDAAHARGIVHRDVKPQNILLSGQHALVADFGIALALTSKGNIRVTERGVSVGTPAYMSPEQAAGAEVIDGRSDIYSLGCVVYEMLTGEVPYPGDTPRSVGAKHLHAPVPDLAILRPALPPSVQAVMERALAKVPADRFDTAGSFIAALDAALHGVGVGRVTGSREPGRVRRWLVAAGVVTVAIAGGLLLWNRTGAVGSGDSRIGLGVMPFRPLDGSHEWSEALPDLLSTYLDGTPGVRVADPWALWRPLRASANEPAHSPDPAEGERLARRAGVSRYVLGTVRQSGGRLDLTLRIYSVGTTEPVATVRESGSADSVTRLAQRAAVSILKDVWTGSTGPAVPRLESVFTQSPDALKAYLAAREAMRRGLTDSADIAITRSITLDSTFALGILDAVLIRTWVQSVRFTPFSGLRDLANRAVAYSDSLTERQKLRLQATLASIETDGPGAARAWNALLQRDSTDLAAAEGLAYATMAYGWQFGATLPDILRAAERVTRIDSTYIPAFFRQAHLLPATFDSARVQQQLARMKALGSTAPLVRAAVAANSALLMSDARFVRTADTLAALPFLEWVTTFRRLRSYRPDRALAMVQRTDALNPTTIAPFNRLTAMLGIYFGGGRLQAIDSLWAAGAMPNPAAQLTVARRVLAAKSVGSADSVLTARSLQFLSQLAGIDAPTRPPVKTVEWDVAWPLAEWNATEGDTNTARMWTGIIRRLSPDDNPHDWRGALTKDIEGQIADRRGDHSTALRAYADAYRLMSTHVDNSSDESPEPAIRWHYAQSLITAGKADSGRAILRSLIPPTSWVGVYVAPAQYALGVLSEQSGELTQAAQSYDAALQLWSLGDASVREQRAKAEDAVRRTSRGRPPFRFGR
ncbi:MAG: serine/threonine-protein kinase [Gemmatimonadaceae bacterium]